MNNYGTVFGITRAGILNTLYDFCAKPNCADGSTPFGTLIQATSGKLLGTTSSGGSNGNWGTIFEIDPYRGKLATLYSFCSQTSCFDGALPYAGLVQATHGNFYGTASTEAYGFGTIFELTPQENFATLYRFCSQPACIDGADPYGGLVQASNGIFYGATYAGGDHDIGAVYSLDTGLGPFASFVRAAGKVGQTGDILGQGFIGTTGVSLNGTAARFTVVSDTFIKATVPAGATTGYVTVTTSTGTLTSNVPFRVIP